MDRGSGTAFYCCSNKGATIGSDVPREVVYYGRVLQESKNPVEDFHRSMNIDGKYDDIVGEEDEEEHQLNVLRRVLIPSADHIVET